MDKVILFIENNTTGSGKKALETAQKLGLKVIFATRDPSKYEYLSALKQIENRFSLIDVETNDIKTLIDIASDYHLDGIITFSK
ncbi:MAG: hypothetical protein ACFFG0_25915 [Candidatus Thorarchaeota archaeon]